MKSNSWLVKKRTEKGMTQEQVAELVSIERSYYTKIENGLVPSVKVAKRIAETLNFEWILFFDNCCVENAQI